ncbi:hypothetical protein E1B28_002701 [Marasmius oreades]|uniref:Uncharacterized protein n=1 Tax=Marasmius oreades TaxID=181124 RepID=A0A9P7RN97_9AGAR|nr:uncharacterized protein E1B28_002701 [Marasmius oreades]KAG7086771.1 hypothetical protein E1B28_002701 [Marasmius oreades]
MYNVNCLLEYLIKYSSDDFFVSRLDITAIGHLSYQAKVTIPPNNQVWLCSSGRPIANFQSWSCWTHFLFQSILVENPFEPTTLEDGRTRLSVKSNTRQLVHGDFVSFIYEMDRGFPYHLVRTGWLSQSCSIFSTMNIPRHEWSDCTLFVSMRLTLIIDPKTFAHKGDADEFTGVASDMVLNAFETQSYLFVLPPPQTADNSPYVITWMLGKDLYYWSSDPDGKR